MTALQNQMVKKTYSALVLILTSLVGCQTAEENTAIMNITALEPVSVISDELYGHFFEHIYHSANGGLWGEVVWNRSFEEFTDRPGWSASQGMLSQNRLLSDVKLLFGNPEWTDYEFTLEARKDDGYEGFLILFRASDEENFYWFNLGGWGNSQHALEKEVNGNRRVITRPAPGTVRAGKWVPVRVRVSGNRYECWLDGQPLINYTDTTSPMLKGGVGLGSWSTAVSYRNIKVTAPDGSLLFSGLPSFPDDRPFPRHWIPSDRERISVQKTNALNGETALRFEPAGGELSILQENFRILPGDPLSGSVWLKGEPGTVVHIRIKESDELLAESQIAGLNREWKEYGVQLQYPIQPTTHNLQIGAKRKSRFIGTATCNLQVSVSGTTPVWIDQLSLMPESSAGNDGFRADLYDAVAGIRPTVIRWPGGCYAELYRWKAGIGKQHERQVFPVNIWDDRDVNSLGTDEFITLCRKLGSEPLLVINSGFHEGAGTPEAWKPWIQEACEWLEYCNGPAGSPWGAIRAANGHPEPYAVKYWEIDNELWRSRVPDPHVYSQAVKIFSEALAAIDPSITVIAHGGNGTDMEWNQVLLDEAAGFFDILSIHHYSDPDGYYQAALDQDRLYEELEKAVATSSNPGIKVYVSEWNAQSTDWRTGLYAGNLLNIFENRSKLITMAGPALFLRHTTANAWDNAFINFDQESWFPAPNYVVMKLWRDHFAPDRLGLTGVPDSVTAVATHDPEARKLVVKLVNNSSGDQFLSISFPSGFKARSSTAWLVRGATLSDRNSMENPRQISPVEVPVNLKRQKISVNLPGLSCLVIETK